MDIVALEVFLAVADNGSFSRAAEQSYLTQPAVSKRIAALEQELGMRVFDRIGRRIHLTEAGTALLPRARRILAEIEDARRAVGNLSGRLVGPLRMATSHHIGLHRLPPALQRFSGRHPQVELDLQFMDSEAGCTAVAQGRLELAVVTLPIPMAPELKARKVWDDPLEFVVGRRHALAQRRRVTIDELLVYPAILPGTGTVTRERVLGALGARRGEVTVNMSSNYLEVLKMLVSIGLGWSALPQTMIDRDLKVVHIDSIKVGRELGIVTHAARTLSNAAAAMIEIIDETA